MNKPRVFYVRAHQNKELAYVRAMEARGYSSVNQKTSKLSDIPNMTFALFDHDIKRYGDSHGHVPELDLYKAANIPVFIYPHSARPLLVWDAYEPWQYTSTHFVPASGHVEVLRAIGYPCPVFVAGWSYCDMKPFSTPYPFGEKIKVLYMPIHPNANGFLCREDLMMNRHVFDLIRHVPNIELTVRHIKHARQNGLRLYRNVEYIQAVPDGSHKEIDAADVVIAHQTGAYIAIARGKPTVMYGETIPAKSGNSRNVLLWCTKHFEEYRALLKYPYEVEEGDIAETIERALAGGPELDAWRQRFIGEPFDAEAVANHIEGYIQ